MARFQDLSNELVLDILEKILPDDILSFSLTSRRIHQLAVPRLEEHRNLRKQYTKFRNMVQQSSNGWHDPGGLLADLLCTIMTDARIGYYVKQIDLDLWNFGARDGWKPDALFEKAPGMGRTRAQRNLKTNMEIIEDAVRAVELIPTEEIDDWLHQIRLGNEDPLVALLLMHTPGLDTIKFIVPYSPQESSYLLKTVQRITRQGSPVKPISSYLKNVEMYFAEGWESLDFVKAFMSLPSLTSIKTDSLFVDGRTHNANAGTLPQASNVTDVSFRNGFLPEKALSELLWGLNKLKSFTYIFQHLWRDDEYTPPFDCIAVISALEANAGQTLEYLRLGDRKIELGQITPVRGLFALREIELQTNRCFAVDNGTVTALTDLLPVSLETLAMYWYEKTDGDDAGTLTEAILDLIRKSKTRLPNLRKLRVSTRDHEEYDALWECLGSDETAQINPNLSFNILGPGGDNGQITAWADNVCTCGKDCFGNGSTLEASVVH